MKLFATISLTLGLLSISCALPSMDSAIIDECVKCGSVNCLVSRMSLDDKIAQKMMPDIQLWQQGVAVGSNCPRFSTEITEINPEIEDFIKKYKFGGIILFAKMLGTTEQGMRFVEALQQANAVNNKLPLMISTDQEGGLVTRLGEGTVFPGNMAMAATGNIDYISQAAGIMAKELKAAGIQMQFGPDADVNVNPANPVIGARSFGDDADQVATNVVAYVKAVQEQGTISCAKHFPGHGDTASDSHTSLPLVDKTRAQWEQEDLPPFKSAIAAGIDMIMTAHIQYPNLDSNQIVSPRTGETIYYPATLSRTIQNDILRGELGFKGVTITDAMNMAGIIQQFQPVDAVGRVFMAGVDIVLMPIPVNCTQGYLNIQASIDHIKDLVNDGTIKIKDIDDSVKRILKLKMKYGLLKLDNTPLNQKIANAKSSIYSDASKAIEKQISDDAITLLKNDENTGIPFKTTSDSNLLIYSPVGTYVPYYTTELNRFNVDFKSTVVNYQGITYNSTTKAQVDATIKSQIEAATHIIIASELGANTPAINGNGDITQGSQSNAYLYNFPRAALTEAMAQNKPLVFLSQRVPYDVGYYPDVPTAMCMYGVKRIDYGIYGMPNLRSAISAILGITKPKGKLPVQILDTTGEILFERGSGISL
ncbi:Beta-hexosaminidase [Smittium culicis]|uniref:beta-N-acetylhexosaminidase n=1 Tax=Smittium culicis TaxID=133412 RepID=A0A1R1YLA5_9FUNG|nr:Beta-hexosaminidase [Smittium culicis]